MNEVQAHVGRMCKRDMSLRCSPPSGAGTVDDDLPVQVPASDVKMLKVHPMTVSSVSN